MREGRLIAVAACIAATAVVAAPAGAATYSNPTPILDPSSNVIGAHPAAPYPSTIAVSGEEGTVTKVRARLSGLSGGPERDLDVLLTGPGGSSLLLSDICSAGGVIPDFTGETFTFDDAATGPIPETCASRPPSGTYKPTNYDTADNFPGIPPPYLFGLSNFRGVSPNGSWKLYAVDDAYPDPVTINGGWSLEITTTGASAAPPATTGVTPAPIIKKKKRCKKKHKRSAAAAKKKRCKKRKRR